MQFTVHAAKRQLSKLTDAGLAGEEVVIAKGSKPVVRLVPIAIRLPDRRS
jgi:prevent-host-death family protein